MAVSWYRLRGTTRFAYGTGSEERNWPSCLARPTPFEPWRCRRLARSSPGAAMTRPRRMEPVAGPGGDVLSGTSRCSNLRRLIAGWPMGGIRSLRPRGGHSGLGRADRQGVRVPRRPGSGSRERRVRPRRSQCGIGRWGIGGRDLGCTHGEVPAFICRPARHGPGSRLFCRWPTRAFRARQPRSHPVEIAHRQGYANACRAPRDRV